MSLVMQVVPIVLCALGRQSLPDQQEGYRCLRERFLFSAAPTCVIFRRQRCREAEIAQRLFGWVLAANRSYPSSRFEFFFTHSPRFSFPFLIPPISTHTPPPSPTHTNPPTARTCPKCSMCPVPALSMRRGPVLPRLCKVFQSFNLCIACTQTLSALRATSPHRPNKC